MAQDPNTINVVWEPITGPEAKEALRAVFRVLLREPESDPVCGQPELTDSPERANMQS